MHAVAAEVNATCVARDTGWSISSVTQCHAFFEEYILHGYRDAYSRYVGRGCFILLWRKEGVEHLVGRDD